MLGRPCPKICGECDPEAPHHWIEDAATLTGYICKHCPAVAVECCQCGGDGEMESEDEDEEGQVICCECDACSGRGFVEVVPVPAPRAEGGAR